MTLGKAGGFAIHKAKDRQKPCTFSSSQLTSSFCSFLVISIGATLYSTPSSSIVMLTLTPFGTPPVYSVYAGGAVIAAVVVDLSKQR